jgi:tetratricopeptide (TPR) repeat protein
MIRRVLCFALAFGVRHSAAAAPDQWTEIRSAHFTVNTDSGEKQGRHIADQFERMRWVFQTLFPKANVDPPEPIVVVAAKNEKVFDTMEPAAYLAKGQMKLGGYYVHTKEKNYILLQLDARYEHPFASVYHEYTHVQFTGASDWMPLWINEGLAEFMQNTEIRDKNVVLGEPSVDDLLYLRQNRLIPLNVLFRVDATSPYYHEEQKGSIFYAESWALTHFLMVTDHDKHLHRLNDYMTLMSHHEDPVIAAEKAFGDLKQFQIALDEYIHEAAYKEFILPSAAAPIDEASYKVRTLTLVDADAVRADVLAYVQRDADARALVDLVLKEDPNNVQAHETMGFIEYRARNVEEAQRWYAQAVKLDSQDCLAHYYFAELSMAAPGTADDKDIEASLRFAIRLNPLFAPAYDRLAVLFAMRRENLDEAHLLSLHAVQLDPGEVVYRVNAANVLMAMQRFDDAIKVLQAAEKVAKDPSQVAMVQAQIERIEDFQKEREEAETYANALKSAVNVRAGESAEVTTAGVDVAPKHPTMPKTGPRHAATGMIRGVTCEYPSALEFRLETAAGKTVRLYNNAMTSIDLTAVGQAASGSMNPCTDFEGRKAAIQYVESTDKTVDGQVIAIELRR